MKILKVFPKLTKDKWLTFADSKVHSFGGTWVAQWNECLPLAQVMFSGSWDRVPLQASCEDPVSSSAYVSPSLSVNKSIKIFKKKN